MIHSKDLVEIGTVQKTHGIQGEIVVTLDRDIEFDEVRCVIMDIDGLWVPFFIGSFRPRSSESVLVHLDGVDSDVDASELIHKNVYVMRDSLPDDGDDDVDGMTADGLIGFTLYDDNSDDNAPVGVVEAIREVTSSNWLFEVRATDGRELLIPIATDLITEIDADRQVLCMELPVGLTDL